MGKNVLHTWERVGIHLGCLIYSQSPQIPIDPFGLTTGTIDAAQSDDGIWRMMASRNSISFIQMTQTLTCCCLRRRGTLEAQNNFATSANFSALNLASGSMFSSALFLFVFCLERENTSCHVTLYQHGCVHGDVSFHHDINPEFLWPSSSLVRVLE